MTMNDHTLERAADLVAQFEGFQPNEYVCPGGSLTFGYGSLVVNHPEVQLPLTEEQAKIYLIEDLKKASDALGRLVKVHINSNQTIALLSFVYNVGSKAFEKSTLLRYLNLGRYDLAAEELLRWNKADGRPLIGLDRRRMAERSMFLKPVETIANKPISNREFLSESLSFEGLAGHYKAMVFKHLFNIGRDEFRHEWEVSLDKVELYLNELKNLIQKSKSLPSDSINSL